jgi:hypothetical protein
VERQTSSGGAPDVERWSAIARPHRSPAPLPLPRPLPPRALPCLAPLCPTDVHRRSLRLPLRLGRDAHHPRPRGRAPRRRRRPGARPRPASPAHRPARRGPSPRRRRVPQRRVLALPARGRRPRDARQRGLHHQRPRRGAPRPRRGPGRHGRRVPAPGLRRHRARPRSLPPLLHARRGALPGLPGDPRSGLPRGGRRARGAAPTGRLLRLGRRAAHGPRRRHRPAAGARPHRRQRPGHDAPPPRRNPPRHHPRPLPGRGPSAGHPLGRGASLPPAPRPPTRRPAPATRRRPWSGPSTPARPRSTRTPGRRSGGASTRAS